MKDLASNIAPVATIDPVVASSDTNGTGVDLQGYESAAIVVQTGVEGITLSTSNKIEFILEDSDDNSTFSAVTSSTSVTEGSVDSSGIFLTLDGNDDTPQASTIGYVGGKRYVRVTADFSGTHGTGTPIAASVLKGAARHNS